MIFFLQDFEHIGRAYCETLMDYYDDNPVKVNKFLIRLDKIRKNERKMKRILKQTKKKELADSNAALQISQTLSIIKSSMDLVSTV